jgi:protein phosphatase
MTISAAWSEMFDLDFGSATDVGKVREANEDAVWAGPRLFVVADGMGGHAAGEVAAGLALQRLMPLAQRLDLRVDDLVAAIADANAAILEVTAQRSETVGMGTTVSGVYLGEFGGSPHWFVFNVGDSRVYRCTGDLLVQVTVDHSEVEELLGAGRITAEQARVYPRRNVITRSLGTNPAPVPDIWVLPAVSAETFVICSDGLPLEVDDADIRATAAADLPAQEIADRLCRMAVDAGGRDNVSVVVVRLCTAATGESADVATAPRPKVEGGA